MNIVKKISNFLRKPDVNDDSPEELWFITIGPSGAGKTSLLACMHRAFENSTLRGFLFPDNTGKNSTFKTLSDAYKQLEEMGNPNSPRILVPPLIQGNEDLRQYKFSIREKNASVRIRFFDYPGAWMNPHAEDNAGRDNYERMLEIVQKSMVLIVAVDTPYLMEEDGRFKQYANIEMIEHVLAESMNPINSLNPNDYQMDKLILLVPVKCEKYVRTREDTDKLRKKIKEAFAATIGLTENPVLASHLALAILPVQTTGNVEFSHFDEINPSRPVANYVRNGSLTFDPRAVGQPFLYAMSFLLAQYEKNMGFLARVCWFILNTSYRVWRFILNTLFRRRNQRDVSEIIQDGLHEDKDEGFEIIHGRKLISKREIVKKAKPLKLI